MITPINRMLQILYRQKLTQIVALNIFVSLRDAESIAFM